MEDSIKRVVGSVYASIAKSSHEGSQAASKVAQAFGYSVEAIISKQHNSTRTSSDFCADLQEEELSSIPKEANMGLSCGNATKYANLKEVTFSVVCIPCLFRVLRRSFHRADLGCGGGLDCFLAAQKGVTSSCLLLWHIKSF